MRTLSRALQVLFWSAVGAIGATMVLDLILEALPVGGDGVYAADRSSDWPVAHLIANRRYVYSAGWNLRNVNAGSLNNMGYVAPFDYVPGTAGVVVLGDSFVESLMNPYERTVQGLLAAETHQPVMQFGVSAASMADYLGVSALIAQRFKPQWAVFVVTEGDFMEGFNGGDGYFSWNPGHDPEVKLTPERIRGTLTKTVRQFALVRYLRYNIKVTPARFLKPRRADLPGEGGGANECEPVEAPASDAALVQDFVRQLPQALAIDPSHVVLVFDSDREAIYEGAKAQARCPTRDSEAQTVLREAARASGMNVIETQPLFADFYAREQRRLDYSPLDGHWNPEAHRLVATEVARVMKATR